MNKILNYFRPPEFESIEQTQKARFLHFALLVSTIACIILGTQNMTGHTHLDLFLFIVGGISFLCIPANKRGYITLIALFVSCLIFVVMTYSLIVGVALRDAALITYPLFIILSAYLFGKRYVVYITLLSIASVVGVYLLEEGGYLHLAEYSNQSQLIVIIILLPAAGFLFWAVTDNWESIIKYLKDTYDLTLAGWGQALEYRDRETEGHSRSVVDLTIKLAEHMGIQRRNLYHLRRGALLHDIGKMAIPDAILLKKGSLTAEEWEVVKKHPLYAKKMLENIPYLKPALDIPSSHHERWDGSGYPEGLRGEAIPFAARIFAVVDVWDALISDRPYRPAWTEDEARNYIRVQSGILFDSKVVEAFFEIQGT